MTIKIYLIVLSIAILITFSVISCKNNTADQTAEINTSDTLKVELPHQIEYSTKLFYYSMDSCDAGKPGCTYIRMNFPIIENGPDLEFQDTISSKILSLLQVYETRSASPDSIAKAFVRNYTSYIKSRGEPKKDVPAWYIEKNVSVNCNSPHYFCISYVEESFTGGAHNNSVTNYFNYSLQNRKEVVLDDIILPEKKDSLAIIGEQLFRLTKKIPANKKLSSEGFFVFPSRDSIIGKFYLNDNFSLGNNGLIFFYNTYEIGPYSSGYSKIVIPYSRIKTFAKPGSLLDEKIGN